MNYIKIKNNNKQLNQSNKKNNKLKKMIIKKVTNLMIFRLNNKNQFKLVKLGPQQLSQHLEIEFNQQICKKYKVNKIYVHKLQFKS